VIMLAISEVRSTFESSSVPDWRVPRPFPPGALLAAEPVTLTIQADKPGPKINSSMWGIFFEDINFGADGGLYAELVKNRS